MIMEQTDAILGQPAAINTKMRKSEHSLFFLDMIIIFSTADRNIRKKYTSTICMYKTFQRLLLLPLLLLLLFVSIIKPNHFHKYCYYFFGVSQSLFSIWLCYTLFLFYVCVCACLCECFIWMRAVFNQTIRLAHPLAHTHEINHFMQMHWKQQLKPKTSIRVMLKMAKCCVKYTANLHIYNRKLSEGKN